MFVTSKTKPRNKATETNNGKKKKHIKLCERLFDEAPFFLKTNSYTKKIMTLNLLIAKVSNRLKETDFSTHKNKIFALEISKQSLLAC